MSTQATDRPKKVTALTVAAAKGNQKLVVVTAYDTTFARLFDPHVDILLVGDSLGMVIQGNTDTLSVSIDDMVYHTRAVARGRKQAHLVADMPFLSCGLGPYRAVENAGRLVAEGGADAVKIEGGAAVADCISAITAQGIPVMGHLGLTPQSVHQMGGYKVQGRTEASRQRLIADAKAIEAAGVYSVVLEGIPTALANEITALLKVPTIGIGAGRGCDGQVLVSYDLLGLNPEFKPKFVKHFAALHGNVSEAIQQFGREVREGTFPTEEHSF